MPVPFILPIQTFRGAVRPPFIEARAASHEYASGETGFGGQSAPPSLKRGDFDLQHIADLEFRGAVRPPFIEAKMPFPSVRESVLFRGAVRPPFIEARRSSLFSAFIPGFGGQSAPPSLKLFVVERHPCCLMPFRGAVRPPFIEAGLCWLASVSSRLVSGGSPPPLH